MAYEKYETKNSLPEKVRADSIALLQKALSDGIDVMLQGKQAHWNVKGPQFISLHELFDKVHDHSRKWVDLIAERIVQLGGCAEGGLRAVSERTEMPEHPDEPLSESEHVEFLSRTLAAFGETCRDAIDETDRIGDPVTSDIFVEIARSVDKRLWMLEAHTQSLKHIRQARTRKAA